MITFLKIHDLKVHRYLGTVHSWEPPGTSHFAQHQRWATHVSTAYQTQGIHTLWHRLQHGKAVVLSECTRACVYYRSSQNFQVRGCWNSSKLKTEQVQAQDEQGVTTEGHHCDRTTCRGLSTLQYRPEAGSRFRFQGKSCPVPRFQRCQTCQFLVPALGHPLANMSHAGSSKFLTKCMITL